MRRAWIAAAVTACSSAAPSTNAPPAKPPPARAAYHCFPGAYYRKLVSPFGAYTKITATATLPTPTFDPARRAADGKPLDNTSFYVGGRSSGGEIDCGLSWEVIREPDGSVSHDRKAFRPFWRNKQWHTAPAEPALYFAPGDVVRLELETRAADQLTLSVSRGEHGGFRQVFTVDFAAPGFGPLAEQELKVVSAIDQAGNEGKPVQPTATRVKGLQLAVELGGGTGTPVTWTDMRCPTEAAFVVEKLPDGRERVDIAPTRE